ncbi:MAG TPA: hypothetical protein VLA93_06055 [Pyrinomonadaceae bacterium]|nr:hypothetical protein [Pyrinomonadaceae bacterium]
MKRFLAILALALASSFSLSAQEHGKPGTSTPRPPSTSSPRPPGTSTPQPMQDTSVPDIGGWVKFTSGLGRFTVAMPSTPTDKMETTKSEHGPYTTHLFIVRDALSVYLIGWVDYDPSFNFNKQSELEANRDNFVKGINATLLTSSPTTIDGYQAIEFVAETTDRVFKSRVYMVGRRPYQIVIGTPKGQDDSVQTSRFFNSFKIRQI